MITNQSHRLILAPMQGLSDAPMRDLLTRIGGFDECVSEFVRITHTIHSRQTWLRAIPELNHHHRTPSGVWCTPQLLGSDEKMMAINALEAVRFGAKKIDLNFGCPAPTVNKHQGGAVLLKTPEKIFDIVYTIRKALPESIKLTAKMRLGYEDTSLTLENAKAIAEGGASILTVHARTKVEGYEPPAHWHWLDRIRKHIGIPVIANGDVFTLDDYIAIKKASGCNQIMIGRGAVMRPDLARQIAAYEQGKSIKAAVFDDEIIIWIQLFIEICLSHSDNPKYAVARLKQWLGMMKKVYGEASSLFEQIRTLKEIEEIQLVLKKFKT